SVRSGRCVTFLYISVNGKKPMITIYFVWCKHAEVQKIPHCFPLCCFAACFMAVSLGEKRQAFQLPDSAGRTRWSHGPGHSYGSAFRLHDGKSREPGLGSDFEALRRLQFERQKRTTSCRTRPDHLAGGCRSKASRSG